MVSFNDPSNPSQIRDVHGKLDTRSIEASRKRATDYVGHAFEMLTHLKAQNGSAGVSAEKLNTIYDNAKGKIKEIQTRLLDQIEYPDDTKIYSFLGFKYIRENDLPQKHKYLKKELESAKLNLNVNKLLYERVTQRKVTNPGMIELYKNKFLESQKKVDNLTKELDSLEVDNFKKHLKTAQKDIAQALADSQIDVAKELAETHAKGTGDTVAALAKGGWKAKLVVLTSLVSKTNILAIKAFKFSVTEMEKASRADVKGEFKTQVELDKQEEFFDYRTKLGNLDRRVGVIGLNGIYRFQTFFTKDKLKGQLKSFTEQNISLKPRNILWNQIKYNDKFYDSKLIPLNKRFDTSIALRSSEKTITTVFADTFGSTGISSMNRKASSHLVNGWETNLLEGGKLLFRALRHAITSNYDSKNAARELLQAAVLQEIAAQGLTLAEAQEKGIELNFNSVSLITPDDLRSHIPGQNDEKRLFLDQVLALESFELPEDFLIDSHSIPVKVNVSAFNFGVNPGAVKSFAGVELGVGSLSNQYKQNLHAMKGFRAQHARFQQEVREELKRLSTKIGNLAKTPENKMRLKDLEKRMGELEKSIENSKSLMSDIELLMANKKAYLGGDNQYEIGAKILNMSNLMDQSIEIINQGRIPTRRITGFKCAFNCMSGKDRTGMMDVVAKTFAVMAASRGGKYPTHQELMKNPEIRKQFLEIFPNMLLKSGNIEITKINTDAGGLKVGSEARLLGLPIEVFLTAQGLSSTTSS